MEQVMKKAEVLIEALPYIPQDHCGKIRRQRHEQ